MECSGTQLKNLTPSSQVRIKSWLAFRRCIRARAVHQRGPCINCPPGPVYMGGMRSGPGSSEAPVRGYLLLQGQEQSVAWTLGNSGAT